MPKTCILQGVEPRAARLRCTYRTSTSFGHYAVYQIAFCIQRATAADGCRGNNADIYTLHELPVSPGTGAPITTNPNVRALLSAARHFLTYAGSEQCTCASVLR